MIITRDIRKAFAELVKKSDNRIERITLFWVTFYIVFNNRIFPNSDEYGC